MSRMTKQQIAAYDKAWRKERDRIRKYASTLKKRGFVLAPDFVPDLKPKRRTQAALNKIKEFRGREYYTKAGYPSKYAGYIEGYKSKAAYEQDKKIKRIRREEKLSGNPHILPKGRTSGEDKDYVVVDRGMVVDKRTGEVVDGYMYDYKNKKILDIESGEEFDGYVSQNGSLIDTETGEEVSEDAVHADTLENLRGEIDNAFESVRDTISDYDWDEIESVASRRRKRDKQIKEKVERIEQAIKQKIDSISTVEQGAVYYNYLNEHISQINESIVRATSYSNGESIQNLDRAFDLIMEESPREFDYEEYSDYGLEDEE